MEPSTDIARLIAIMARLRHPEQGCPWDIEQSFQSVVPFTIEEAYEVADAIQRRDMDDLKDELGDLLLQVVFHSRMAEEASLFDFGDVVESITTKLVRRHPHVFGDARNLSPAAVKALWADIKAEEKRLRAERRGTAKDGHLDSVATTLPALMQAFKLQARAAKVGFDWNDPQLVIRKIAEELDEVSAALAEADPAAMRDEVGDLLFAAVNLARHLDVDPDSALAACNAKFRRRFGYVERTLEERGQALADASLDAMERLWQDAKALERLGHFEPESPATTG